MTRNRTNFRQRDVTAAIKGAERAGCVVARVEIERDGRIIVVLVQLGGSPTEPEPESNEWDEVFDDASSA